MQHFLAQQTAGVGDAAVETGWKVLSEFGAVVFMALVMIGTLVWLIWYMISVRWPQMERSFLDALARRDELATQQANKICERLDEMTTKIGILTSRVDILDSRRHHDHPQQQVDYGDWKRSHTKEEGKP